MENFIMQDERGVLRLFMCVYIYIYVFFMLCCLIFLPHPLRVLSFQNTLHILWKCLTLKQTKRCALREYCVCMLALLDNSHDGTARQNSSS